MFSKKANPMLDKLRAGKPVYGMQIYSVCPDLVEITGYAGMDFYMLDMEHVKTGYNEIQHCLRAGDSAGITGLCRVKENTPYDIRTVMEAGAQGIVVPHVNTREDALRAKQAALYPPYGIAGICPAIRASHYSSADWDEYLAYNRTDIMLMPLIEDPIAVDNIDEILSVLDPNCDAIWFGRADYAQCLIEKGGKMDWVAERITEDFKKVLASAKKFGIHVLATPFPTCTPEVAKANIELGAKIVLFSIDEMVYYNACASLVNGMKELGL